MVEGGLPMLAVSRRTAGMGLVALLLVLLLAGCSSGDDSETATTQGAPETTVPAEDVAAPADDAAIPEAEAPSDSQDAPTGDTVGATDEAAEPEPEHEPSEVPVWSWVVAGLLLLAAVVWMSTRSGSASRDDEAEVG
jgi:hypothetical protein